MCRSRRNWEPDPDPDTDILEFAVLRFWMILAFLFRFETKPFNLDMAMAVDQFGPVWTQHDASHIVTSSQGMSFDDFMPQAKMSEAPLQRGIRRIRYEMS